MGENRREAPPPLDLVQRFVNTVDLEDGTDTFVSVAALAEWLAGAGLLPAPAELEPTDLRRAVTLREGLRARLAANTSAEAVLDGDAERVRELDALAAEIPLLLAWRGTTPVVTAAARSGVERAWGMILAAVAEAEAAGTWRRLKACRAHRCRGAFYDASKNRSGVWCSMSGCGTEEKKRVYVERRRRRRQ